MLSIQCSVLILLISSVAIQGQYKFSNCGPANNPIQLKTLQITPHPMKAPGFASFVLGVDIAQDLVNPIQTKFDLKATAFGITLPIKCENGVGSCTYPDWCEFCKTCSCPIKSGRQTMNIPMNLTATIPIGSKATVAAEINFRSATGQTGCVKITNIDVRK